MNFLEDLTMLVASFVAALFGQGGGVLYTPIQIWNGYHFETAATTSLFLIMITSISATFAFKKSNKIDWAMALAMEIPTTLGAFVGGYFSHYFSPQFLGFLLSGMLFFAAWFTFNPVKESDETLDLKKASSRFVWIRTLGKKTYQLDLRVMIPTMIIVGALTSMVGIGGGVLKVSIMTLIFGVPISIAVGSSAFMVGITAAFGLLGHISTGHIDWLSALVLAIPVFVGAQLGSRISVRLDSKRLSRYFGLFILLVALFMLFNTVKRGILL